MKSFLSICIPTFNRGEIVYQTVKKCLEYKNPNIEVVVSDNCSEDNTEELLSTIADKRFKYFKNDYNNGADNLISVLTYASGEYLLLTSDEDPIVIENMDKIIDVILEEKPAILKASAALFGKPYTTHRDGVYNAGFEAIRNYGSGCRYMSGYIYNKNIMDKVLNGIKGTNINGRFGAYNFTNLAREMLQYGSLCFRKEIITNQEAKGTRDMNTHFIDGKLVYSPECRIVQLKERLGTIKRIDLNEQQKYFMCEYYITKNVISEYKADYEQTFSNKFLYDIKKEPGSNMIYEYYVQNRETLKNKDIFKCIEKAIDECIEYIDSIGIFKCRYKELLVKYPDINKEYLEQRNKMLYEFKLEKEEIDRNFNE